MRVPAAIARCGNRSLLLQSAPLVNLMMKTLSAAVTSLLVLLTLGVSPDVEWPVNGGPGNIRYSPLTQVDRTNVAKLEVAWTYDSHDAFKGSEMQSNPVVVGGVLYATTPTMKVIALDAATGRELWKFDPSGGAASGARFRHRGVTVHDDRVFVTYRNWLYALDRTSAPASAPARPARSSKTC